ncbi:MULTISPECIES: hypothetical protein [unclassified Streptomyces]|uniref:hypothetical protein n=1 Tax=unclassified Streptomyces TaxID=2593676 RepID=UPI000AB991A9|nr:MULTISPECIES: hypothetical protein [unclassified Streptomyces]
MAALAPCTARALAPARRIRRQCRELHTDVQNTAAALTVGINGHHSHGRTAARDRRP